MCDEGGLVSAGTPVAGYLAMDGGPPTSNVPVMKSTRSRSIGSNQGALADSSLSTSLGRVPAEFAVDQQQKKTGKPPSNAPRPAAPPKQPSNMSSAKSKRSQSNVGRAVGDASASQSLSVFGHLPEYESLTTAKMIGRMKESDHVHPKCIALAIAIANGKYLGATERCRAMLECFQQVIVGSYQAAADQAISRHMDSFLRPQISYVVAARPLTTAMGHAIRHLKLVISKLPPDISEDEAKSTVSQSIDMYIKNRIDLAGKLIVEAGLNKIEHGDVVLTFSRSTLVQRLLKAAKRDGKRFRVIVVAEGAKSTCHGEGIAMARELCQEGIGCTLISIGSIGFVLKEASKVVLGAQSIFSNGSMLARCGSAVIGLMAHLSNLPVIVLCETIKFAERVQLDAFVYNELGDPAAMGAEAGKQLGVRACNLVYDVMPPEYITVIVSEVGLIPVTSVMVVLREQSVLN